MKKLISAFCVITIFSTLSIPCFAAPIFEGRDGAKMNDFCSISDDSYFEKYKDNCTLNEEVIDNYSSKKNLTINELNAVIEKSFDQRELTIEEEDRAQEIADTAMQLLEINKECKNSKSRTHEYDNDQLLRSANYIETILDLNEDISESRMSLVLGYAQLAKTTATNEYPNDSDKKDACRHFTWNYYMAKNINTTIARTAGNNHEWGLAILDAVINYYHNMYDKYIDDGYSDKEAATKALNKTIFFIPGYKYDAYCICKSSLNNFKLIFDNNEYIMDFWNNCYGRSYKHYSSNSSAWTTAKNNGEVILKDTAVTNTHYNNVRDWDWYSY